MLFHKVAGLRLTILGAVNFRLFRVKSELAIGLGVDKLPVSSSIPKTRKDPAASVQPELPPSRLDAWNTSARQYDSYEKRWHFYGTVADAMIRQFHLKEDSRVLELACGTGACTLKLAKIARTGKVVALDFSEGMLNMARENAAAAKASNIVFVHGDAGDISQILAGQKFNFAVCNSAFWHFPDPEKVLTGLLGLLTESGKFAVSLPSWVDGNSEVRQAFRVKAREVLLKHGVAPEMIEKVSVQRSRQKVDLSALFRRCGFVAREVTFEFKVTPESREEWRQILVFSDSGRWNWFFPDLDPAAQKEIREELNKWRKTNFPHDSSASKWRILVAHRCDTV